VEGWGAQRAENALKVRPTETDLREIFVREKETQDRVMPKDWREKTVRIKCVRGRETESDLIAILNKNNKKHYDSVLTTQDPVIFARYHCTADFSFSSF